jgi:integrase/recombinase XerC
MEQLLTQFLEHLRYERNLSEHTLRNYQSDLQQFHDHLAHANPRTGKRVEPALAAIDHITVREWLATLHAAQKQKASIARKLAALRTFFQFLVREGMLEMNPAKLVSASKRNFPSIFRLKKPLSLWRLPTWKRIWASAIAPCWS